MGKKAKKRPRWRRLSLEEEGTTSDASLSSALNTDPLKSSGTAARAAAAARLSYSDRVGWSRNQGHQARSLFVSTHVFDEDEYTKIQTPRQDMIFKKSVLARKRCESAVAGGMGGSSVGDSACDDEVESGAVSETDPATWKKVVRPSDAQSTSASCLSPAATSEVVTGQPVELPLFPPPPLPVPSQPFPQQNLSQAYLLVAASGLPPPAVAAAAALSMPAPPQPMMACDGSNDYGEVCAAGAVDSSKMEIQKPPAPSDKQPQVKNANGENVYIDDNFDAVAALAAEVQYAFIDPQGNVFCNVMDDNGVVNLPPVAGYYVAEAFPGGPLLATPVPWQAVPVAPLSSPVYQRVMSMHDDKRHQLQQQLQLYLQQQQQMVWMQQQLVWQDQLSLPQLSSLQSAVAQDGVHEAVADCTGIGVAETGDTRPHTPCSVELQSGCVALSSINIDLTLPPPARNPTASAATTESFKPCSTIICTASSSSSSSCVVESSVSSSVSSLCTSSETVGDSTATDRRVDDDDTGASVDSACCGRDSIARIKLDGGACRRNKCVNDIKTSEKQVAEEKPRRVKKKKKKHKKKSVSKKKADETAPQKHIDSGVTDEGSDESRDCAAVGEAGTTTDATTSVARSISGHTSGIQSDVSQPGSPRRRLSNSEDEQINRSDVDTPSTIDDSDVAALLLSTQSAATRMVFASYDHPVPTPLLVGSMESVDVPAICVLDANHTIDNPQCAADICHQHDVKATQTFSVCPSSSASNLMTTASSSSSISNDSTSTVTCVMAEDTPAFGSPNDSTNTRVVEMSTEEVYDDSEQEEACDSLVFSPVSHKQENSAEQSFYGANPKCDNCETLDFDESSLPRQDFTDISTPVNLMKTVILEETEGEQGNSSTSEICSCISLSNSSTRESSIEHRSQYRIDSFGSGGYRSSDFHTSVTDHASNKEIVSRCSHISTLNEVTVTSLSSESCDVTQRNSTTVDMCRSPAAEKATEVPSSAFPSASTIKNNSITEAVKSWMNDQSKEELFVIETECADTSWVYSDDEQIENEIEIGTDVAERISSRSLSANREEHRTCPTCSEPMANSTLMTRDAHNCCTNVAKQNNNKTTTIQLHHDHKSPSSLEILKSKIMSFFS